MRRFARATTPLGALLVALMLGAGGCGGGGSEQASRSADVSEAAPKPSPRTQAITIRLREVNTSGQTGSAILTPSAGGEGFEVALEVTPPKKYPGASQHAHIHDLPCAEYAKVKGFSEQYATVANSLSDLSDGASTSTVFVSLPERTKGTYSINVHEQNGPYTAVACGDIPKP